MLAAILFMPAFSYAQSSFDIPTLIPSENEDIGGSNRQPCIGLADMFRTGDFHLYNLPCYVKYLSQMLIGVAGTLSVIFVMIGGYRYLLGEEQQDAAKKTITYALVGLAVSLSAWIIVDTVLQAATE